MLDAPELTYPALRTSEGRPGLTSAGSGRSATVHSCFGSALNITTPDGSLLTIAAGSVGGLPNGVVADLGPDFRGLGIRAGMAVAGDDRTVRIEELGILLDLTGAVAWSPRLIAPPDGVQRAATRWRERRTVTRALALAWARPGGLAGLLGLRSAPGSTSPLDVTAQARPILAAVTGALVAGDRVTAARWARGLIGLGPGLTPSGDDAVVGLEAALHALGSPMAGFIGAALGDLDERTTAVAATFVRHASRGEFAERLHVLLAGLLGPDDVVVRDAIEGTVAWGATSGTDLLVGVLCGLDVATHHARRLP